MICRSCWALTRSDAPPVFMLYLYPLPATVKLISLYMAPASHAPTHSQSWLSQGCGHWGSHLTEQVAWLQVCPPAAKANAAYFQCTLVRFFHTFPLVFKLFELKRSLWCEERSCILRRNCLGFFFLGVCVCVILPMVIFVVCYISCYGNVAWHLLSNTAQLAQAHKAGEW